MENTVFNENSENTNNVLSTASFDNLFSARVDTSNKNNETIDAKLEY